MQFHHQKDFIFRRATASDRGELCELQQKYGAATGSTLKLGSAADLVATLEQNDVLFQVALNSNGVMIGFLFCTQNEWQELVVNPNFMKKEVKEALLLEVKNWVNAHPSSEKTGIALKPKLIAGDWKAFVKKAGCKIEVSPQGQEILIF